MMAMRVAAALADTALVVSGHDDLGTSVAERLVNDGWHVVLVVDDAAVRDGAERKFVDPSGPVHVVGIETHSLPVADQVVSDICVQGGHVDAAVIDLAAAPDGGLLDMDVGRFASALEDNVQRAFVWSRRAAMAMTDSGRGGSLVLLLDSLSDGDGDNSMLSVAGDACLGALERMSRVMAADLGPRGVRVNCVRAQRKEPHRRLPPIPLGRKGRVDEVAAVAAFLAGSQSSFMTGVTFPVDGGVGVVR